jgi:hypothetical protein
VNNDDAMWPGTRGNIPPPTKGDGGEREVGQKLGQLLKTKHVSAKRYTCSRRRGKKVSDFLLILAGHNQRWRGPHGVARM